MTSGAGELLNNDGSEGDVGDRDGLAVDEVLLLRVRSLDENLRVGESAYAPGYRPSGGSSYALVVDNLADGGELALVLAVVEENDTADLNEAPLRGDDGCFTHFGSVGTVSRVN